MKDSFLPDGYPVKAFGAAEKFLFFFRIVFSLFTGGEKCISCEKKLYILPLCKNCLCKLKVLPGKTSCRVCGKKLVSEIELCSACRKQPVLFDVEKVYQLFSYRLWKKNLLFSWKMLEKRSLSSVFSKLVYQKLKQLENELKMNLPVVPVPPRPGKIKEKGWDQIQDLCFYLKWGFNVRIIKPLRRISRTQQKKLDRTQRLHSINGSYSLIASKKLNRIKLPESVVLIDDVLTTGSTIQSCSALLRSWGVKKVYVITIFGVD